MFALGLGPNWNLTADGTDNSTGGCSGPGPGAIEYCVQLTIEGGFGFSTEGLTFELRSENGSTLPFVNVTLVNPDSGILATYTSSGGWVEAAAGLPVSLWSTDSLVVNVGRGPLSNAVISAMFTTGTSAAVDIP